MKNAYVVKTVLIFFLQLVFCRSNAQTTSTIYLDSTQQIIRGFGAANILPWRPDMTPADIDHAFGTGTGELGFSLLRLRIPSDPEEFSLNVATAKAAHERGVTIIASPWSPPPALKTNNYINGGELREDAYDDYAAHLNSFVDYMASNGVPVYAVSVQNEPDVSVSYESCHWTASQMLKFVKENGASVKTKLIAPESYRFNKNISNAILNDPEAEKNVDIVGGHLYGGGLERYPLAEGKGKELWMTEWLHTNPSWATSFAVAKQINDCMNAGMNAYIWWYIVRYYGPIGEDGYVLKRGYAMSHFSRFVRPGYYKIKCDAEPQNNVFISAYKDSTSSKIIIVAFNLNSAAVVQNFTINTDKIIAFVPYTTTGFKSCLQGNPVNAANGNFTCTLEPASINTFVSVSDSASLYSIKRIPDKLILYQNYPNPFNSGTDISFFLPEDSFVSLKLYNILGEEAAELCGKEFVSGFHSVRVNANSFSSGIYIYRLTSRSFTATKKMLLQK